MSDEPEDLIKLERAITKGVDHLWTGNPDALELLGKLSAETPRWIKAHLELEHSIPSPSSILSCVYQLWQRAHDVKVDRGIPANWKQRAAVGVLQEPYWIAVLGIAGHELALANEPFRCGEHMRAHPDGMKLGEWLVEFKSVTGWVYQNKYLQGHGVSMDEPRNYAQAQLYQYATGYDWTLLLVSPADPSSLQSQMRRSKRYGPEYELPAFHLQWVRKNDDMIEYLLARADMIATAMRQQEPPQREFSGHVRWPCDYCQWQESCNDYFDVPIIDPDDIPIIIVE